jgi:hypothetical protein
VSDSGPVQSDSETFTDVIVLVRQSRMSRLQVQMHHLAWCPVPPCVL